MQQKLSAELGTGLELAPIPNRRAKKLPLANALSQSISVGLIK